MQIAMKKMRIFMDDLSFEFPESDPRNAKNIELRYDAVVISYCQGDMV